MSQTGNDVIGRFSDRSFPLVLNTLLLVQHSQVLRIKQFRTSNNVVSKQCAADIVMNALQTFENKTMLHTIENNDRVYQTKKNHFTR
jgi:hypothetical protein